MNEEKCHMITGVECIFFDYELKEKIRLQKHIKEVEEDE
jgi:hypothetical protein